ncbi:MAG: PDZ domain-containing protein, partial [Alphaproteobacteria bacterium]|nr:PDZ domain-containing protein [Alphaproteobacteria bacterium]
MTALGDDHGVGRWRLGLRIGSTALLAFLVTSCVSSPLQSRTFSLGHPTFEDAVEDIPALGQVSAAFDRNVLPTPSPGERLRQLDLFAEVFDIASQDYVDPVPSARIVSLAVDSFDETAREIALLQNEEPSEDRAPLPEDALSAPKLMASALARLLGELDAHSGYLPPDLYREMKVRTRGEFGGIGIEVTMEEGLVKVVAPIDGTPGSRAGLQAGDLITHVNGEAVLGLSLAEAVKRMRGRRGSSVVLKMRRPPSEEPFQVTIVRDVVRIRAVRARAEGNVAYLRITTFNERVEEALYEAMDELRDEIGSGMVGLVLDLRNNPGGLLDQA